MDTNAFELVLSFTSFPRLSYVISSCLSTHPVCMFTFAGGTVFKVCDGFSSKSAEYACAKRPKCTKPHFDAMACTDDVLAWLSNRSR